jgi:hypothetical protein
VDQNNLRKYYGSHSDPVLFLSGSISVLSERVFIIALVKRFLFLLLFTQSLSNDMFLLNSCGVFCFVFGSTGVFDSRFPTLKPRPQPFSALVIFQIECHIFA